MQVDSNNTKLIQSWVESMQASGYEVVRIAPSQLVTFVIMRTPEPQRSVSELLEGL